MNKIDDISDEALLKEVGRRIAYLRISAKMKQGELAAKAGLSRYALSRLMRFLALRMAQAAFASILFFRFFAASMF